MASLSSSPDLNASFGVSFTISRSEKCVTCSVALMDSCQWLWWLPIRCGGAGRHSFTSTECAAGPGCP